MNLVEESEKMELKNINITPTMGCNLKCKLCGLLVPHYDFHPQMSVEEFHNTLESLFLIVDKVKKLQITGGEPLLYPHLEKLVEESFLFSESFDELWILTNGTIPFSDELKRVIIEHKDRIFIHCSDYGLRIPVTNGILNFLNDNDIRHRYMKYYGENQYYDGWVDNGDFVPHNRSLEENEEIFKNCAHVCWGGNWYVRSGQLHWCGRSLRGTELGIVPLKEEDYLDLFDKTTSVEEKKEKMKQLLKNKSIAACDFCNGHYGTKDISNRFSAGEQMEKGFQPKKVWQD